MQSLLLPFFIINYFSDNLEYQIVDINNASYEELSSIPLITDEDIKKILRQRPYRSFDEFADSLNLTLLERNALKNYVFISRMKRNRIGFLISSKYDSIIELRYSTFLNYKNFTLKVYRNKAYFGYKYFYFGNLRILKGVGLISSGNYRNNLGTSIYFSENFGGFLNYKELNIFLDSSKNYLFLYSFRNNYIGFLGKENFNIVFGFNYKFLSFELLKSQNYLNYAYSLNFSNEMIGIRISYKRSFENYWDYRDTIENYYIATRFRYSQFKFYSRFSNNYQYHSINYNITDGSNLELRLSKSSYKLEFENEEGLEFAIFDENAIKIGYKFISIYQYKDVSSICDEYIPLYGCYVRLSESENYEFAIHLRYKFLSIFATKNYLYFWVRFTYLTIL